MPDKPAKSYLKTRGLTPIKGVFALLCILSLFETLDLFYTRHLLGNPEILSTPALLLGAGKVLFLIISSYLCFEAISRIHKRMRYFQEHNAMTNLPNRSYFHRKFQPLLVKATEKGENMAVIVIRLDDYDDLNYTLGHKVTDAIVQEIYRIVESTLKKPDLLSLLTSRSLVVGYTHTNKPQATEKAKTIMHLFKEGISIEGCNLDVNLHCGIAYFPDHGHTSDILIQHAAIARFLADKTHSRISYYDPNSDPYNRAQLSLMSELLKGIRENHMRLFYQPKISIKNLKTTQVETLVRWIHPEHGFMNPDDFIPLAERTGYINDLTAWILDGAIQQCALWLKKGYCIRVAINLSTENLMSAEITESIPKLAEKYQVNPDMIILEITESAVMKEPDQVIKTMHWLAKAGFQFAMDDFGTGYSSLEYLKKLPMSELKIDKIFVQNIDRDETDRAIVEGATKLAHSMGLGVVAEGVETEKAVELLKEIGCDKLQGYFFSKPLPLDQFEQWLESARWGAHKTT